MATAHIRTQSWNFWKDDSVLGNILVKQLTQYIVALYIYIYIYIYITVLTYLYIFQPLSAIFRENVV